MKVQGSSDITFVDPVALSVAGEGITAVAGRSIFVNNNITTTNGAVSLIANAPVADGTVDAGRGAGAAAITMLSGKTINAGSGDIVVTVKDGAGLTDNTSGTITLANLTTTGNVLVKNDGATAGSSILHQAANTVTASSVAFDISNAANTSGTIGASFPRMNVVAGNIEARSQGGDIWISNNGNTTIGGAALGGLTGISVTGGGGNITFLGAGDITVAENITNSGNTDHSQY